MVTVTVLGNNLFTVALAISVGVVPRFARVTRGTILSIRERDFVEAARALGASPPRIIWSHVEGSASRGQHGVADPSLRSG